MQSKLLTLLTAAVGFSSLTLAAPVEERQACSVYPWFIGPHPNTVDCSDTPAVYQPTSGPESSTPQNKTCAPLYDPNGASQGFLSVAVNRDACPDQKWQINLYTDEDCTTTPVVVTTDSCVAAPGGDGGLFLKFDALDLTV